MSHKSLGYRTYTKGYQKNFPTIKIYWPAYSYGDWVTLCSAHTDGWIGLIVGSYNASDNSYEGLVIDQQISLYNTCAYYWNIGPINTNNSGFPLSAMTPVDSSHWYARAVGGSVHADGRFGIQWYIKYIIKRSLYKVVIRRLDVLYMSCKTSDHLDRIRYHTADY